MIGEIVTVKIDRPIFSKHPEYTDLIYKVNYGYIEGLYAADGEEQDAYILGVNKPLEYFTGKVVAIIHRYNDVEEKYVVAPIDMEITENEIRENVEFQEKYFIYDIRINNNSK